MKGENMKGNPIKNSNEEYQPETCNIGEKEVEQRMNFALKTIVYCVLFILTVQILGVPMFWRFLLIFPATGLGVSFQQWYFKFCVAFGIKGIFNFGEIGRVTKIENKEHKRKDRIKAWRMIVAGMLFGVVAALLYYFAPI